jgi:hypothetical protein
MSTLKLEKYPIDLRRYYLSDVLFDHPSEFEFYKILRDEILGKHYIALIQYPLSSLVGVRKRNERGWTAHFGKIARKRIDFLICQIEDLKPLLAIELDGSTHFKVARQRRDLFLEQLFEAVGLPELRVPVQTNYDKRAIALQIAKKIGLIQRPAQISNPS